MGRRIRSLAGVDRVELDGKPVGLQCAGGHHDVRRLSLVPLFHRAEAGVKALTSTAESADTRQPEWVIVFAPVWLIVTMAHHRTNSFCRLSHRGFGAGRVAIQRMARLDLSMRRPS